MYKYSAPTVSAPDYKTESNLTWTWILRLLCMKLGYLKVRYSSDIERLDSSISSCEMSGLDTSVCINNGRLKMVKKGQIHPDGPCQKLQFATSPSSDLVLVRDWSMSVKGLMLSLASTNVFSCLHQHSPCLHWHFPWLQVPTDPSRSIIWHSSSCQHDYDSNPSSSHFSPHLSILLHLQPQPFLTEPQEIYKDRETNNLPPPS